MLQNIEKEVQHDNTLSQVLIYFSCTVNNGPIFLPQRECRLHSDTWCARRRVELEYEKPIAYLAEVTGMVLVEIDAVMVHTTSVTATTRMLTMLALNG